MISHRKRRRVPRIIREQILINQYGCHPNCPHIPECIAYSHRCKRYRVRRGFCDDP